MRIQSCRMEVRFTGWWFEHVSTCSSMFGATRPSRMQGCQMQIRGWLFGLMGLLYERTQGLAWTWLLTPGSYSFLGGTVKPHDIKLSKLYNFGHPSILPTVIASCLSRSDDCLVFVQFVVAKGVPTDAGNMGDMGVIKMATTTSI